MAHKSCARNCLECSFGTLGLIQVMQELLRIAPNIQKAGSYANKEKDKSAPGGSFQPGIQTESYGKPYCRATYEMKARYARSGHCLDAITLGTDKIPEAHAQCCLFVNITLHWCLRQVALKLLSG